MSGRFSTCGPKHLARKNELVAALAKLHSPRDILLVETGHLDAERLTATLRVLFGYKAQIRTAATLPDAVDCFGGEHPNVVFLDDSPESSADAEKSIPMLRGAGFSGPIIVVSEKITSTRRARLLQSGANEVIRRDDVDSVSVAEALACARQRQTGTDDAI
jgi:CheY-like chemotaxis protein